MCRPLLGRSRKPCFGGFKGKKRRLVVGTSTSPCRDEVPRTTAADSDENGLETFGVEFLGQPGKLIAKLGEPEVALGQICPLNGRDYRLSKCCGMVGTSKGKGQVRRPTSRDVKTTSSASINHDAVWLGPHHRISCTRWP